MGVLTGMVSPLRGSEVIVRVALAELVRAATRFTGPINWIKFVT